MLIKVVLQKWRYIFIIDEAMEMTPVYTKEHAIETLYMIGDVFWDIDIDVDIPGSLDGFDFDIFIPDI